ncbi:MAG: hypothetical protein K9M81_02805 [Chthoniobacterales bacterium]|nr:hypothetical protein [Chthoniobacterales bacterium]
MLSGLTRIFHTDSAAACEQLMDTASASNYSSGSVYAHSRRRNPSPSLTRSLPLVSPFQGCVKAVSTAVSQPPVLSASGFAVPRDEPV